MTTQNTRPEPLVPEDVDLRDFPGMWVDTDRLVRSDTWILGNSDEKAAAFTLWAESWHQVPAASLPDNDRVLAKLSQAERWTKSRGHALRGWIACNDGRLYHPVVAEKALEAWIEKLASAISGATGNAKRWQVEVDTSGLRTQFRHAVETLRRLNPASRTLKKKVVAVILASSGPESHGESGGDGESGSGGESHPDRKGPGPDRDQTRQGSEEKGPSTRYGELAGRIRRELGFAKVASGNVAFQALVDAGATFDEFAAYADKARSAKDPFTYLVGTLANERERVAQRGAQLHRGPMPAAPPPRGTAVDRQTATMNALTGKDRPHERQRAPATDTVDVAARVVD